MNVIAKNMYAQVDNEGNMFQLLDEIMDAVACVMEG